MPKHFKKARFAIDKPLVLFNIFAKKAVREHKIPFEIGAEKPNNETLETIQEVQAMESDPTLGKSRT